jgi:hypothetical protein
VVGAPGFEPGTPSPPDWCANRAALRSAEKNHVYAAAAQGARARDRTPTVIADDPRWGPAKVTFCPGSVLEL